MSISDIIIFPKKRNKAIINIKKIFPELYNGILEFSDHMFSEGSKTDGIDCYAIVKYLSWNNEEHILTNNGKEYLMALVKPHMTKEDYSTIKTIDVVPENSDNIYDITGIYCVTENHIFDFCTYRYDNKPAIEFKRVYTQEEIDLIFPKKNENFKDKMDLFNLFANLNPSDYDAQNIIYQKMLYALDKKLTMLDDVKRNINKQALLTIRGDLNEEDFEMF